MTTTTATPVTMTRTTEDHTVSTSFDAHGEPITIELTGPERELLLAELRGTLAMLRCIPSYNGGRTTADQMRQMHARMVLMTKLGLPENVVEQLAFS